MIRTIVATLTLTVGSYLALCPMATADQPSVDIIFTGVVPPTCAVMIPGNNSSSGTTMDQGNASSSHHSVQVSCNDNAQINDSEYTSASNPDNFQEPLPVQTLSQEFLTITLP